MMKNEVSSPFRLAAIDLDGTLLGPRHGISAENVRAVRQLQAAGAQVVLASGRHYNAMRQYADALPDVQWIVSCQGGEVSDRQRTTVLSRKFLPEAAAKLSLEAGQTAGFATIAYAIEGVFTDSSWDEHLEFYADLAGHRPAVIAREEMLKRRIFKVIWLGKPEAITAAASGAKVEGNVQMVRTHARILEFMPADASKGCALEALASRLGIDASDAVVFGDGENDIPMFEWAGLSVAMAHGWPLALQRAKRVAPQGAAETALARAVDLVLSPALAA